MFHPVPDLNPDTPAYGDPRCAPDGPTPARISCAVGCDSRGIGVAAPGQRHDRQSAVLLDWPYHTRSRSTVKWLMFGLFTMSVQAREPHVGRLLKNGMGCAEGRPTGHRKAALFAELPRCATRRQRRHYRSQGVPTLLETGADAHPVEATPRRMKTRIGRGVLTTTRPRIAAFVLPMLDCCPVLR